MRVRQAPSTKLSWQLLLTLYYMSGIPTTSLPIQSQEIKAATGGSESQTSTRRAGTLVKSEEWWRNHYADIGKHGYKLRPRYHPLWEPSWIASKKDFYKVEDGQATIVCCHSFF
jgi:hypothetical protein